MHRSFARPGIGVALVAVALWPGCASSGAKGALVATPSAGDAGDFRTLAGKADLAGVSRVADGGSTSASQLPRRALTKLVVGAARACALSEQGEVYCWGAGEAGQGMELNELAVAVAVGDNHVCAVTSTEHVACWGDNRSGQVHGGNDLTGVTQVALGRAHSCALTKTGTVTCWGANNVGQLGAPAAEGASIVKGVADAVQIAASDDTSCALVRSGAVFCWGANDRGLLGSAGRHTLTVETAARVPYSATPTRVDDLRDAITLAMGDDHACAATRARRVRCWGGNQGWKLGAVGDDGCRMQGDADERGGLPTPRPCLKRAVEVDTTRRVEGLVVGGGRTCVLDSDGGGECWGVKKPRYLGQPGGRSLALGGSFDCLLTDEGQVRCASDDRSWDVNMPPARPRTELSAPAPQLAWRPADCGSSAHTRCAPPGHRLTRCTVTTKALTVDELERTGAGLAGTRVSIQGRLVAGGGTPVGEISSCYQVLVLEGELRSDGPITISFVLAGESAYPLVPLSASTPCSRVEPLGRKVLATGVVRAPSGRTTLEDVTMCLL